MSKKYVCQKCKVAINPFAGNGSNNFPCPRCLFMDSLPIINSSKEAGACSICLEDFNSKTTTTTTTTTTVINELPCRHHFHKECISEWISRRKYSCPLCRYKLPIDDAVRPARYEVENGHGTYIPPSDVTWFSRMTTPQVVITWSRRRRWRRWRRIPQVVTRSTTAPPQVRTTTSGGGIRTTTTATSDHNNTTTMLQDEDGDTIMLDDTILQDGDGDTIMLDAA